MFVNTEFREISSIPKPSNPRSPRNVSFTFKNEFCVNKWLRKEIYFIYFNIWPNCFYLFLLLSFVQIYNIQQHSTTVNNIQQYSATVNNIKQQSTTLNNSQSRNQQKDEKRNLKCTMTYCKCWPRCRKTKVVSFGTLFWHQMNICWKITVMSS